MAIKRIPVTIALRYTTVVGEGYETATPGLVVHRAVYTDGTTEPGASWTITHAQTGMRVAGNLPTRTRALKAADELGSLTNWNRPLKGARFGPKGLGKRVKRIVDAA